MFTTRFQRYRMSTTSTISTYGASARIRPLYRFTAAPPTRTPSRTSTRCVAGSESSTRRFRSTGEDAELVRATSGRRRRTTRASANRSSENVSGNRRRIEAPRARRIHTDRFLSTLRSPPTSTKKKKKIQSGAKKLRVQPLILLFVFDEVG